MTIAHRQQEDPARLASGHLPGEVIRCTIDGEEIEVPKGQTVAAALLARGRRVLRRSERNHKPHGLFCAMGVCFECLVSVDGRPNALACQTTLSEGMCVETRS